MAKNEEFALLEREEQLAPPPHAALSAEPPHASLSVELAELSEDDSTFPLQGRFSFLWASREALDRAPTSPTELLYPDLSAEAQALSSGLVGDLLQLLRDVTTDPDGGYGADPFHPKKPIAKMRIPGESHFYKYRVSKTPASQNLPAQPSTPPFALRTCLRSPQKTLSLLSRLKYACLPSLHCLTASLLPARLRSLTRVGSRSTS